MSASSWGCELKYAQLFFWLSAHGQPLREAVSWNITDWRQTGWQQSQPLREAVSWNVVTEGNYGNAVKSASSWGCELKSYADKVYDGSYFVSLFVRLWVEIRSRYSPHRWSPSASSWGCELKCFSFLCCSSIIRQPLREAVSWNNAGFSHFRPVRCQPLREAVSWNGFKLDWIYSATRQPLREAVSWNLILQVLYLLLYIVSLFVRLWVEILYSVTIRSYKNRQPLREAVSWNFIVTFQLCLDARQPLREAVSWNTVGWQSSATSSCQPLREAVSWNPYERDTQRTGTSSASSWGCELKWTPDTPCSTPVYVSLFVRLWVEICILP